jgi:hypothetical protein
MREKTLESVWNFDRSSSFDHANKAVELELESSGPVEENMLALLRTLHGGESLGLHLDLVTFEDGGLDAQVVQVIRGEGPPCVAYLEGEELKAAPARAQTEDSRLIVDGDLFEVVKAIRGTVDPLEALELFRAWLLKHEIPVSPVTRSERGPLMARLRMLEMLLEEMRPLVDFNRPDWPRTTEGQRWVPVATEADHLKVRLGFEEFEEEFEEEDEEEDG